MMFRMFDTDRDGFLEVYSLNLLLMFYNSFELFSEHVVVVIARRDVKYSLPP